MKSIQQVLWRGVLALSLMAVGIGSGLGMPPAQQSASPGDCPIQPRVLVADHARADHASPQGITLVVLRRPLNPAG